MRNSVELTLARLAFRQVAGSRRALLVAALGALPVLLALLMTASTQDPREVLKDYGYLYQILTVSVLLPIVALVVGTSVFGAEVDDGTITYVLGKPVARWRMVVTRVAAAGLATCAVLVPSTLVSGMVGLRGADAPGMVTACTVAVAVGSFLYCAFFVALSLTTRRALVAGLAYVVLWEGSLSNVFGGSRALSIRQYTLAFADGLANVQESVFGAQLKPGMAAIMAAAVAVLATLYAIRRLRRFEIGEAV